ncbi:MAG TPA: ThuA domain-containing protein [Salegentibacter sp.]|nr:ThuA domain-containing protein [Salegentibacter sp.]
MNKLRIFSLIIFTLILSWSINAQEEEEKEKKEVLVFYKTEGFWHKSIPTGHATLEDIGEKNAYEVKLSKDSDDFNEESLKKFALVIFLNTTGDVLNEDEQAAFENYIANGGSFFGIHAAADTEHDWPWYGELVGGYFVSHPKVQRANVNVEIPDHPTVSHLPNPWSRIDEWYNYKNLNPENKILLSLDETTYKGGENGKEHPIAWYRDLPGGGVSIYTGGGHRIQSYIEPGFREHLSRCILFALGDTDLIIEQ